LDIRHEKLILHFIENMTVFESDMGQKIIHWLQRTMYGWQKSINRNKVKPKIKYGHTENIK
jgi:hypothetical protein